MEEIFDPSNNDPFSPYWILEEEVETLKLAIDRFLESQFSPPDDLEQGFKHIEGYITGRETLDQIAEGQRLICTEAEIFLVGISTDWFTTLFDKSIANKTYRKTAEELGVKPEEFIEHAIVAYRIRQQIPEHIQALM